ncbi:transposase [Glutamicibacter sp. X7]
MNDASDIAENIAVFDPMDAVKESGAFDEPMGFIKRGEIQLDGKVGFIRQLIRAGLERRLKAELTDHPGLRERRSPGPVHPELPQRFPPKTVSTVARDIDLQVPRDRAGTFTPTLVSNGSRRTGGLDSMIISFYAGGMTVRDIVSHLETTIGTQLSRGTISKITDEVLEEVAAWKGWPMEEFYPILYLDAIVIKVRDGHQVRNKVRAHGHRRDRGRTKHVLGIWVTEHEGTKFAGDASARSWPTAACRTC